MDSIKSELENKEEVEFKRFFTASNIRNVSNMIEISVTRAHILQQFAI